MLSTTRPQTTIFHSSIATSASIYLGTLGSAPRRRSFKGLVGLALLATAAAPAASPGSGSPVDRDRLLAARSDGGDWLSHGRTYDEQRHSPLRRINAGNVGQLGLAWFADLDDDRAQEATPIVIDGILYVTGGWSVVSAYDGLSGRRLWTYDPQVPRETLARACCDAVNRGVAAWGDRLFVGTLDGRLIALDRRSGRALWSVVTVDRSGNYTITGAPRVIDGRVIIGNAGAEFGVRGYVSAYAVDDGRQLWRFYTVPGNPANGFEGDHLRRAAGTWHGEWWRLGGGGTVWDSMAYDPQLDLLYIGVGNGSPWNQEHRSEGRGDNLYLSSIVALKPATGDYVWHYQTTPGDSWDFTATQHIILADLMVDGRMRQVLMQAPKNGFFYVIDRATGQLISARNFVPTNWASSIDPATGRPIENPEARYYRTGRPFVAVPGGGGAHNWQPMAFDPALGLVFIPAQEIPVPYFPSPGWRPASMGFNLGFVMGGGGPPPPGAPMPPPPTGALIAWDPVAQKERWRVAYPLPWNGGLLSTAGGLVFQGSTDGNFAAFDARDGRRLWTFAVQTGVVAGPVTYEIDGEQYVAVTVGRGGSPIRHISRLLVFKLGGTRQLPDPPPLPLRPLQPPDGRATPQQVAQGSALFARYCTVCHGGPVPLAPDLRYSKVLGSTEGWKEVVIGGILKQRGMVSWEPVMNAGEAESVRQFVIEQTRQDQKSIPVKAQMPAR